MGGGGWKKVALGGNKERFVRKKGFWFVKMGGNVKICAVEKSPKSEIYAISNLFF